MTTLTYPQLAAMLRAASVAVKQNHEMLSKLDAATGDGDHGTTMVRVADALVAAVDQNSAQDLAPFLEAVGWGVMSVDGGSTGPLLGSLFMGMGQGLAGKNELTCADLAAAFEAGLANLSAQTPAKVGDKTMMDALVPAIRALRAAADAGQSIPQALATAADAAMKGSDSTKDLQARFGRARNLGARTIGQIDPGSRSIAIMFGAFEDAVK